jgi:hypothetical protein
LDVFSQQQVPQNREMGVAAVRKTSILGLSPLLRKSGKKTADLVQNVALTLLCSFSFCAAKKKKNQKEKARR